MNKIIATASLSLLLVACAPLSNQDVGTLSGAAIGGLLGSQFGGGTGKLLATGAGVMIGGYLGGNIGRSMDRLDRLEMQHALESAPTGRAIAWTNPDTGCQYSVKPTRNYIVNEQPCREYITHALIGGKTQQIYGKACRQADGSWRVVN